MSGDINYSKDLLSDALTNDIKSSFRREEDPNACWDHMGDFLNSFLDEHCPIKTFRSKENTPAWVTRDIIILAKDRDRAWKVAKTTGLEEDWARARQLRNWANNATKAAKADFIQGELKNNASDPKKFWRNIKDVLPDKGGGGVNIVNPITQEILPKHQQAHEINNFFANVGDRLSTKFKGFPQTDNDIADGPDCLTVDDISPIEVLKLINTISMYKSSGLENVSSKVVKDL